jgi:hypothetical protein
MKIYVPTIYHYFYVYCSAFNGFRAVEMQCFEKELKISWKLSARLVLK